MKSNFRLKKNSIPSCKNNIQYLPCLLLTAFLTCDFIFSYLWQSTNQYLSCNKAIFLLNYTMFIAFATYPIYVKLLKSLLSFVGAQVGGQRSAWAQFLLVLLVIQSALTHHHRPSIRHSSERQLHGITPSHNFTSRTVITVPRPGSSLSASL